LTCQFDGNPHPTTVTWKTWAFFFFHFQFCLVWALIRVYAVEF